MDGYPMPPFSWVHIEDISSVGAFIDKVLALVEKWGRDAQPWFRGQSRESHSLVPGALRTDRDDLNMFYRFQTTGTGFLTPKPSNEWEWYAAAQHYELPTRLLDWTSDPLAALYFAVRGMKADDEPLNRDVENPPVVWMMDAPTMNLLSYGVHEVPIPLTDGGFTVHWLPSELGETPTSFKWEGDSYTNARPIVKGTEGEGEEASRVHAALRRLLLFTATRHVAGFGDTRRLVGLPTLRSADAPKQPHQSPADAREWARS